MAADRIPNVRLWVSETAKVRYNKEPPVRGNELL